MDSKQMARLLGSKGGKKRMSMMTKEQRIKLAKLAAKKRWSKK